MRSSSVWLVFSTLAYQLSLVGAVFWVIVSSWVKNKEA
jgi:hypothetical protein